MKCICKRYKEGFVNLSCPKHIVLPKVDKKHLAKKGDKLGIIEFGGGFYE